MNEPKSRTERRAEERFEAKSFDRVARNIEQLLTDYPDADLKQVATDALGVIRKHDHNKTIAALLLWSALDCAKNGDKESGGLLLWVSGVVIEPELITRALRLLGLRVPMFDQLKVWCVQHLQGWCACYDNRMPPEGVFSCPTVCRYYVVLPSRIEERTPTCPDCLSELRQRSRPVCKPESRCGPMNCFSK